MKMKMTNEDNKQNIGETWKWSKHEKLRERRRERKTKNAEWRNEEDYGELWKMEIKLMKMKYEENKGELKDGT